MITEQQIRSVALFFFFAFLDEKTALSAAAAAVAKLKARLRRAVGASDASGASDANVAMVEICAALFENEKKRITRGKLALTFESGWSLPDHFELAPWARFHKDASDEELLALLFARVIGASESEIARALGISEGTARYRIGRAVGHLGVANRLAL